MTEAEHIEALRAIAGPLTERIGKAMVATIGPVSPSLQDVTTLSCIASLGLFEAAIATHEDLTKERLPGTVRGELIRKLRSLMRKLEG